MPDRSTANAVHVALMRRYGESLAVDENLDGLDELERLASRKVHRRYLDREVDPALLRLLCACALSAPSKSDLQQADIIVVKDVQKRQALADMLPDQTWMRTAPVFLVFLANGRRLAEIAKLRNKPFVNDHLDQFFNASVDTGILLASFLRAAEAVGLGCCPISVIRDHAEPVSRLLELPQRVIPVVGLCLGWPSEAGSISPRLCLASTLHEDRYEEGDFGQRISDYDGRRAAMDPYGKQRDVDRWGNAAFYGWSEDKARQFAEPHCVGFGAFVRERGFRLD